MPRTDLDETTLVARLRQGLVELAGCVVALTDVAAIQPGDAALLTPGELEDVGPSAPKVQAASGAVRGVARQLCHRLGKPGAVLRKDCDGVPIWPEGLIGSLAHDRAFVAAVVARPHRGLCGIGVDIEAHMTLDADTAALIVRADEMDSLAKGGVSSLAAFAVKEAVYKAVYPNDRVFLEFHDVALDVRRRVATTAYGRQVFWRVVTTPRVLALAWW